MSNGGGFVVDTPKGIACYRMLALKHGLKFETLGMRRKGPSAFSIIKREFNLKGDKKKVLNEFSILVDRFCRRDQPLAGTRRRRRHRR